MSKSVGGDLLNLGVKQPITAAANLAALTFVNKDGTVPASAAAVTGGVIEVDTPSGDTADVKMPPGVYKVLATGVVTDGIEVEILQNTTTVYGNINGVKTLITCAGVSTIASGKVIGRACSSGFAGDAVLVDVYGSQSVA